jgi:hypothetical protein
MPGQPTRADIDQLAGWRLIQSLQQCGDTRSSSCDVLWHPSQPATATRQCRPATGVSRGACEEVLSVSAETPAPIRVIA